MHEHESVYEQVLEFVEDGEYEQALSALTYLQGEFSDDAYLTSMRARLLGIMGRLGEAEAAAKEAVRLDPDFPFAHETVAVIALLMQDPGTAIAAAQRARALMPDAIDALLLEARANVMLRRWEAVERLADTARRVDPSSEEAAFLHASARMVRTGDLDASVDWEDLSRRFPLVAFGRIGRGWSLLRRGDARKAEQEFRDALALDGSAEWAREGLVQSLKAKYPGYGLLLRAIMALESMPPRTRFMVILGGMFGFRLLRQTAQSNPAILPIVAPLMALYIAFILGSWLANPLLSLVLMAKEEGRRVLSADEKLAGKLVGGTLLLGGSLALASLTGWQGGIAAAFGVVATSLIFAAAYTQPTDKRGKFLWAGGLLCAASVISPFVAVGGLLVGLAVIGAVISTWVASISNLRADAKARG